MTTPLKISYSSANRFKECPTKYYLAKKYQAVKKPSAFGFGSAIEEGVTEMITSRDLSRAINMFARHWQFERGSTKNPILDNPDIEYYDSDIALELVANEVPWANKAKEELIPDMIASWDSAFKLCQEKVEAKKATLEEAAYMNRIFWYSCLLRGKLMLQAFYNEVLPTIEDFVYLDGKPMSQYKISMEDAEGNVIEGYIDYVLKLKGFSRPVIIDCKTAGKPYDKHKMVSSDQLKTYAAYLDDVLGPCDTGYMVLLKAIRFEKSCPECEVPLDFAPQSKKCKVHKVDLEREPFAGTQVLTHSFSPKELDSVLVDYENIIKAIKSEIEFKNASQCMNFNRPCEFYDICWKNKNPEEINTLTIKKGY